MAPSADMPRSLVVVRSHVLIAAAARLAWTIGHLRAGHRRRNFELPRPMHATGGRRLRLVTAFHYKLVVFDKFSAHTAPDQGPDWSTAETCAATRECVCVHTGHRNPCTRFDIRIVVENELYTEFNVSVK